MSALSLVAFALTAAIGCGVTLIDDPRRMAIALNLFGFVLALLFFSLEAPDVALAEVAVGNAALPLLVLACAAKVKRDRDG